MIFTIDTSLFDNIKVVDFDEEGPVRNQLRQIHEAFQKAFGRFGIKHNGFDSHIVYTYVRDSYETLAGIEDEFGTGDLDSDDEGENGHELFWIRTYAHLVDSSPKSQTFKFFSKDFSNGDCSKLTEALKSCLECLQEYEYDIPISNKIKQALAALA